MSYYREKGKYYDVPSDDIDLRVENGMMQPNYDPMRYMNKQKEFAKQAKAKLSQEKYTHNSYA